MQSMRVYTHLGTHLFWGNYDKKKDALCFFVHLHDIRRFLIRVKCGASDEALTCARHQRRQRAKILHATLPLQFPRGSSKKQTDVAAHTHTRKSIVH